MIREEQTILLLENYDERLCQAAVLKFRAVAGGLSRTYFVLTVTSMCADEETPSNGKK